MNTLLEQAKELAKQQFAGMTDRVGVDYYEGHLCSVAELVNTEEEKIVAFLHDILEDTDYPEEKLRKQFGDKTVDAILLITHKGRVSEADYFRYILDVKESGNALAIAVKIADLTNNSDYRRLGANSPEDLSEKDKRRFEKYQISLEILKLGMTS